MVNARIGRRNWFLVWIVGIVLVTGIVALVLLGAGVIGLADGLGLFTTVLGVVAALGPMARRWSRGKPRRKATASRSAQQSIAPPMGQAPVALRGRDAEMTWLRRRLASRHDGFVVLCGLGGVGKTAIALCL